MCTFLYISGGRKARKSKREAGTNMWALPVYEFGNCGAHAKVEMSTLCTTIHCTGICSVHSLWKPKDMPPTVLLNHVVFLQAMLSEISTCEYTYVYMHGPY